MDDAKPARRAPPRRPASSRGDALVVADSDGGNQRELVPARGGRHVHWPAWSRDQKWIYFISSYDTWQSGQSEIYRVPASGGRDEPVIVTLMKPNRRFVQNIKDPRQP